MTDTINVPRKLLERAFEIIDTCTDYDCTAVEIGRLLQAPAQPAQVHGWQMVPVKPTEAMCAAGFCVSEAEHDPAGVYKAMLYAAPQPSDDVAKDAARYRWLRDPCSGAEKILHYSRGDYGKGLKSGEWLDAAIDAAMTGGRK